MLNFDQALAKAFTLTTEAEFLQLVRDTSADAIGDKTVLYSGSIGDTHSSDYAKNFGNKPGYRVINNSDVGRLLNNSQFKEHFIEMLDADTFNAFDNAAGPNSAWGIASKNFVDAAPSGTQIIALTTDANPNRVFSQVEIQAIVDNPNITNVNDIPRSAFMQVYNNAGGGFWHRR